MKFPYIALSWALASITAAVSCSDQTPTVDCNGLQTAIVIEASAGCLQSDGSVTVYGSIAASAADADAGGGGWAELSVRNVYVGGVEVQPVGDAFNFRSWTVTLPRDRLSALDDGTGRAHIPVDAYVYGGCIVSLPRARQPVIAVVPSDGGTSPSCSSTGAPMSDAGTGEAGTGDAGTGDAGTPDAMSEAGSGDTMSDAGNGDTMSDAGTSDAASDGGDGG